MNVPLPVQKPTPPAPVKVASAEPSALLPAQGVSSPDTAEPSQTLAANPIDAAHVAKSDRPQPTKVVSQGADHAVTSTIPKQKAKPGFAWFYPVSTAGFWLAALVLLTTMLFVVKGPRGRHLAAPLMREPVEHEPVSPPPPVHPGDSPSYRSSATAPAKAPRPREDEWLPSTLDEAFNVLGASPETNTDLLKVMVKRLRRISHPDHAINEEDRRARELRLKQVNVAWEIVTGRRRARHSSFTSQDC